MSYYRQSDTDRHVRVKLNPSCHCYDWRMRDGTYNGRTGRVTRTDENALDHKIWVRFDNNNLPIGSWFNPDELESVES